MAHILRCVPLFYVSQCQAEIGSCHFFSAKKTLGGLECWRVGWPRRKECNSDCPPSFTEWMRTVIKVTPWFVVANVSQNTSAEWVALGLYKLHLLACSDTCVVDGRVWGRKCEHRLRWHRISRHSLKLGGPKFGSVSLLRQLLHKYSCRAVKELLDTCLSSEHRTQFHFSKSPYGKALIDDSM